MGVKEGGQGWVSIEAALVNRGRFQWDEAPTSVCC